MNFLRDQLKEFGYSYLPNTSEDDLKTHLNQLGNIIDETDVIAKSDSKSLVTSDKYLDFHTDNHLAKYIVWHCKVQAKEGGISLLCDAESVFERLTNEEKKELSGIHVYEHKMYPENRNSNPIVKTVDGENNFYYSFWLAREKYRELPVFKKWRELIQNANHIRILLNVNDVLIIDNHRILHGRTEIIGERYLKRYWLNPEYLPTRKLYSQT
ncbi:MAG: hypothetical protein EP332_11205 [Bacteroidetes bacterium]|nr:MAG: hypothetical protein EP332_11205 [Bacteroidota bacterium]